MGELAVTPVRHGPFPGRLAAEDIATYAAATAVRTSRAGTQLVVHFEQIDAAGRVAVEQWWTMVLLGIDDPGRVVRVAVRFASPTPLDSELTVNAYGINHNSIAFEATSKGVTTITHGRLDLRQ